MEYRLTLKFFPGKEKEISDLVNRLALENIDKWPDGVGDKILNSYLVCLLERKVNRGENAKLSYIDVENGILIGPNRIKAMINPSSTSDYLMKAHFAGSNIERKRYGDKKIPTTHS